MTLHEQKKDCCGCTACSGICPQGAIEMMEDEEGFLYPQIDPARCNGCGACRRVCGLSCEPQAEAAFSPLVYAAKHKSEAVRSTSTSGGAFTALSDSVLEAGGVIYGAMLGEDHVVRHGRAEYAAERDRFKGSKYVQSALGSTFQFVRSDLLAGRWVLFTGTPCQCAGLKRFLTLSKTGDGRLYLCDLVCHGTASPLLWNEHIRSCEKIHGSRVRFYTFRSKVKGWHQHTEQIEYEDGCVDFQSLSSQKQKELFYANVCLRPACHICAYACEERVGDITIADFWGIEKVFPDFDDNKGVSLVIINSSKANSLWELASRSLEIKRSSIAACVPAQLQMQHPSVESFKRERFWNDYRSRGYDYVVKKYTAVGFGCRAKRTVASILEKAGLGVVIRIARQVRRR